MKSLLLLARISFIYNICLVFAILLRYYDFAEDVDFKSTIIVAGYILSFVFNITLIVICLTMLVIRKSGNWLRPRWLFVANAIFFIIQIFLLFR